MPPSIELEVRALTKRYSPQVSVGPISFRGTGGRILLAARTERLRQDDDAALHRWLRSLPGLISGCLLVYSLSISAFVTPALMGNSRERLVGQQIYDKVLVSFNWPGAASLSLTLVLVTAALMFGALFATRRAGRREKAS